MLLEQISKDVVSSMKAGDQVRVGTLRYLLSEIKKYEIDTYPPATNKHVTDEDVLKIIRRQVKTHRESIEAFRQGKREDLVLKETEELKILESFLPKELTDNEIRSIVTSKAKGINNFGQVMGIVMKEISGRAGGERVAEIVKELLGK